MKGVRQGYERLKQRCLTSQSSLRASHGAYRTISPSFSPVFYRINVPKDVQLRCMGFHTITEETAPSVQVLPVVLDGHIAEIQLESDIDGTSRIFRLGIGKTSIQPQSWEAIVLLCISFHIVLLWLSTMILKQMIHWTNY